MSNLQLYPLLTGVVSPPYSAVCAALLQRDVCGYVISQVVNSEALLEIKKDSLVCFFSLVKYPSDAD